MTGTTGVPPVGGGNTGRTGVPPVAFNTFVYSYLPGTDLVFCYTCGGFSRTIAYEPYRDLVSAITNRFGSRVISTFEYANDAAGRRTAISRGGDAMGPLSDGDVTYTYDAAGNRMTRTENCETITYTLGVGDRLASYGRAGAPRTPQSAEGAYTYDIAGNVTRTERDGRPTLDIAWNSQYQLVSVSTNGVFAEGYAYDALDRRVSTTTLEGTTRHVYDDNLQCIADIDEQGNVVVSYTWGEGIDRLLAVTVGDSTYYALTDIQGTVWGYVDLQNNVVARWQYDAWGNVVDEYVAQSAIALARLRYRFQGREWSVATSLINFRMRWYDSETGRWLSKDPIGLCGGLNLYAFCGNDPVDYRDPDGNVLIFAPALMLPSVAVAAAAAIIVINAPQIVEGIVHFSRGLINTAADPILKGGNSKNAGPSSRERHQKGDARRKRDQERSRRLKNGGNRSISLPGGGEDDDDDSE